MRGKEIDRICAEWAQEREAKTAEAVTETIIEQRKKDDIRFAMDMIVNSLPFAIAAGNWGFVSEKAAKLAELAACMGELND